MKYEKPEITLLANAVAAIQSSSKFNEDVTDSLPDQPLQSISAYEADE